mmetsp:Transcript_44194/g.60355  ORF Transcript_44194/g.60355 Transcript_44194/m.60355 type:complete len:83 (-) Transcript_44194:901-1149(-)
MCCIFNWLQISLSSSQVHVKKIPLKKQNARDMTPLVSACLNSPDDDDDDDDDDDARTDEIQMTTSPSIISFIPADTLFLRGF